MSKVVKTQQPSAWFKHPGARGRSFNPPSYCGTYKGDTRGRGSTSGGYGCVINGTLYWDYSATFWYLSPTGQKLRSYHTTN